MRTHFFFEQHFETPQHFVLMFELMEGGDLWNYLRNLPEKRALDGPAAPSGVPSMALSEEEARSVFQQVLQVIIVFEALFLNSARD